MATATLTETTIAEATLVTPPIREQWAIPSEPVRLFSIEEYHAMIDAGILTADDNVELLEGLVVKKVPKNPRHTAIQSLIQAQLARILPDGYFLSIQNPVTTETSEPEPDIIIVRGTPLDYLEQHPGPIDAVLVIEVSDSSLRRDRSTKKRIFASSGVSVYWIANLQDSQIEEYITPSIEAELPNYQQRRTYRGDDVISVNLDGQEVATLRVADLLP